MKTTGNDKSEIAAHGRTSTSAPAGLSGLNLTQEQEATMTKTCADRFVGRVVKASALAASLATMFCIVDSGYCRAEEQKKSDIYEIPKYGERTAVTQVFLAKDGGIFFYFTYKNGEKLLGDFYDAQRKARLFPADAFDIANVPGKKDKLIAQLGLSPILPSQEIDFDDGVRATIEDASGDRCKWPYTANIKIYDHKAILDSFMMVRKPEKPSEMTYRRDCENVSGSFKLKTAYENVIPKIYKIDQGSILIAERGDRFLIRISKRGGFGVLRAGDFVIFPADAVLSVFKSANSSQTDQQKFVDRAEMIIGQNYRRSGDSR